MKAIAYLRIATTEIACPKDSFTNQEKSIQNFCSTKNIELARVFTDIGSGLKNFQDIQFAGNEFCFLSAMGLLSIISTFKKNLLLHF